MEDWLTHHLAGKVIMFILLMIGGTLWVATRKFVSFADTRSTQKMIKKIKARPQLAISIAEQLDIPYALRDNFTRIQFDLFKKGIRTHSQLGDYHILHTEEATIEKFLILTKVTFVDFDVSYFGGGADTLKILHINFLLCFDRDKLVVQSDLYHTTKGKFLREDFLTTILSCEFPL